MFDCVDSYKRDVAVRREMFKIYTKVLPHSQLHHVSRAILPFVKQIGFETYPSNALALH